MPMSLHFLTFFPPLFKRLGPPPFYSKGNQAMASSYRLLSTLALLCSLVPLAACNPSPIHPIGLQCSREEAALPGTRDCLDLSEILWAKALKPSERKPKKYGGSQREMPAARTVHIPKMIFINKVTSEGALVPNNCGLLLEDHPISGQPNFDLFTQRALADLSDRVVSRCLITDRSLGTGFPGIYQTVTASLSLYVHSTGALTGSNATDQFTYQKGNETWTLLEEDIPDSSPLLTGSSEAALPTAATS